MPTESQAARRWILVLLALLLLARLAAMAGLPLMDTTEARYGDIGRRMAELGDWVTPWFDAGVPFWGKPPLSFWLTAASMRLLGISEIAARLPHLLCGLLIAALVWQFARRQASRREALLATSVLLGSTLFFVSAGAVMTDTAMVLCTTLAMFSCWFALNAPGAAERRWMGWLFFVAQGLGLLAKGPVAVVLSGLPILLWIAIDKRWQHAWRGLPWLRGSLLALAIAAPWYVLAELRTPGFLNYFLLGEHWQRFLMPGWRGDLYGHAHEFARGTIWGFAWGALLPWSVLLPLAAWCWRRESAGPDREPALRLYLLLWLLLPLIFFTAARNIIWTYALPSLPAAALLMARWMARRSARAEHWVAVGLAVSLAGAAVGFGRLAQAQRQDERSARALVAAYQAHAQDGQPLMYAGRRPFSAAFYSQGQALRLMQLSEAAGHLVAQGGCQGYVVVPNGESRAALAEAGLQWLSTVGRFGEVELVCVAAARADIAATGRHAVQP
ncbi:glycosyltransferase family 39 protein [Roseateles asaccharophilus]|uniref:4-amino-4-deoxy-L-arabinose transferase-like glycosyltransferase n=1 Tax=Roseateles asaccharophilus TaxID=582607 RepID=A0ABU2A5Z5_9BURK|nr:glycosyltransferase family 39 protein [Roseateles asaccharophilus]MDR7331902.1 4-amino-4-deoxy-L-arabinose transferase-like glycosyltransferase [Roseateles asaccharophilus]